MKRIIKLISPLLALLLLASLALAQGTYALSWWTADGGGYTFSTGGEYSLGGTAGQPDTGPLSGGGYTLFGGFWAGLGPSAAPGGSRVYLPVVLK